MTLASSDPRVYVGHDGVKYLSRTLASCDMHIRDLTARIKVCEDPVTGLEYEADRDALLDVRAFLMNRKGPSHL